MLSIVCVFNDEVVLKNRLLAGLEKQTVPYDLILVDNTKNRFQNASSALNYGAKQAKGEYVIFVHQDVVFLLNNWLSEVEKLLRSYQPEGWVGVAGVNEKGEIVCCMVDSGMFLGFPFTGFIEIQTLDEALLIHKAKEPGDYFDEQVPGWHAYGVEACCRAIKSGFKNHAISLPIWHDSKGTNLKGLNEAHKYVWGKYKNDFKEIFTTCDILPESFQVTNSSTKTAFDKFRNKLVRRLSSTLMQFKGYDSANLFYFEDFLEKITADYKQIHCLHGKSPLGLFEELEASSFVRFSQNPRKIIHKFIGDIIDFPESECLVIYPELSKKIEKDELVILSKISKTKKLIICLETDDINNSYFKNLQDITKEKHLVMRKVPVAVGSSAQQLVIVEIS